MAIGSSSTLFEVTVQSGLHSTITKVVSESLVRALSFQMLPLVLFSGLLVSLSFAQDYEQGLIQTMFSLPVSRASIFVAKFVAIVIPLTLLSWGATFFVMFLNFQSTVAISTVVFQLTAYVLPITLLAIMFYAGLGAIVSLIVKRTTKAAFISIIMGLFFWFISQLEERSIGALAEYMVFTPFKAPVVTLGRMIGLRYAEGATENVLPAWGFFVLILFYALVFLVPAYLYFTKKFEVEE
jgi:ABC-type transport system involved in multi-copper enzyme maturation permease subunit